LEYNTRSKSKRSYGFIPVRESKTLEGRTNRKSLLRLTITNAAGGANIANDDSQLFLRKSPCTQ